MYPSGGGVLGMVPVLQAFVIQDHIHVPAIMRAVIGNLAKLILGLANRTAIAADFTHGFISSAYLFYSVVKTRRNVQPDSGVKVRESRCSYIGMEDPVQSSWMNPAILHAGQAIKLDERCAHVARSSDSFEERRRNECPSGVTAVGIFDKKIKSIIF